MCIICVDFQKEKMTIGDARRAYSEMVEMIGPEHAREVREMIAEAERVQLEKAETIDAQDD